MPLPFSAIGQKCSPLLSTPTHLTAQVQHNNEDSQHSLHLASSHLLETDDSPVKEGSSQLGYSWDREDSDWRYSLSARSGGVVINKLDYSYSNTLHGDITISHKSGELHSSRLHLMLKDELTCSQVWYDLLGGVATFDVVYGKGPWSIGTQVYDPLGQLSTSYVLGYRERSGDVSVNVSNDLRKWSLTGYKRASKDLELGIRSTFNGKSRTNKIEFGGRYTLDKMTTLKARVENTVSNSKGLISHPKIGLTVQTDLEDGLKLSVGSSIDLTGKSQPKTGCTLSFSS